MKERYGDDYFKRIGKIGGESWHKTPRWFEKNPALASIAGAKGGRISKRGLSSKPKTPNIDHGVTGIKRPRKLLGAGDGK